MGVVRAKQERAAAQGTRLPVLTRECDLGVGDPSASCSSLSVV